MNSDRRWLLPQGVLVTLAIGLHNIPEGLAVATVLVARGVSPKQAIDVLLLTERKSPPSDRTWQPSLLTFWLC